MRRSAPSLVTPFALLAALSALAAVAGCAAAPSGQTASADTEGRDCFNVRSINGFGYVDRDTIRVNVGPSRSYELDTFGNQCFNLRWANRIAVRTRPSSYLCVGDGASVDARIFTDQNESCLVDAVRRAPEPTPEEETTDDGSSEDGEGAAAG